jgi:alkylation response protein AidB-like acyl-CoA dehydrogenase
LGREWRRLGDGGGGRLLDLTLAVEQQGRRLAPAPVVETAVAARLFARLGRADLLARVAAGEIATAALHPSVDGTCALVPAGAVAALVVALTGDDLVVAEGVPPPLAPNLGSAPLATRRVGDGEILLSGDDARAAWSRAVDEWRVLTAALLVGAGSAALGIGVDYVRERRQFDAPIGSFQAVAHRLADAATDLEGARLVAYEAAWRADGMDAAGASASLAFAVAAEAAQRAAAESLHFHGGYGFMLEYDVQLYFRRVKAWTLVLGDPSTELARVASLALARR